MTMSGELRTLASLPGALRLMLVTCLPGTLGRALRYRYWRKRLKHLGENVRIDAYVHFQHPEYIEIEDNCWIDAGVMVLAGLDTSSREKVLRANELFTGQPGVVHVGRNVHVGPYSIISGISAGVYISDDCTLAANCKLYAFSHHYRFESRPGDTSCHFGSMGPPERQCMVEGPIFLGPNTGVALNAVLLPGACIPENCFVAVNSVVSQGRLEPNSLIAGHPAVRVRGRFATDQ